MRRPAIIAAICVVGLLVPHASGQAARRGEATEPSWSALLIDQTLSASRISVVELDGDGVVYLDEAGRRRRSTISSIMALLPAPEGLDPEEGIGAVGENAGRPVNGREQRRETRGFVTLVDGQRFPGQYVPTSGGEDSVIWHHPQFGDIGFPLERVAWVVRDERARRAFDPGAPAPVEDELILVNGDRIRGFIIGLGDPVEIESAEGVVKLDMSRISGAVFSNPRESLGGLIVWLKDGTVAQVEQGVQMSREELAVSLESGEPAIYDISELRAIAFDTDRIVALSSIDPVKTEPMGDRAYTPPTQTRRHPDDRASHGPPSLNAEDIYLPGPMRVTYELPPGARRIAGTASLSEGSAPWGDCEVVLEVDGREVWRRHVHSEAPDAAFNVEIDGRELTVTVEPGRYGPIKDLVYLRRVLILVDDTAG